MTGRNDLLQPQLAAISNPTAIVNFAFHKFLIRPYRFLELLVSSGASSSSRYIECLVVPGGKSLNILATAFSSFFSFFSALSESVPSALPRHRSCFVFASNI